MATKPTKSSLAKTREKANQARPGKGTSTTIKPVPPRATSSQTRTLTTEKPAVEKTAQSKEKVITYRASEIPSVLDQPSLQDLLARAIGHRWGNDLKVKSWAADYINSKGMIYRTATFECNSLTRYLESSSDEPKDLGIKKVGKGRFKIDVVNATFKDIVSINIDTIFDGFTPFSPISNESKHIVDCIAVHGWGSHAFGAFKATDDETFMWLRDRLTDDVPQMRIWTYGYQFDLNAEDSVAGLDEHAESFRNHLRDFCKHTKHPTKFMPLVFVAHSLGGLILKQALVSMKSSTVYNDFSISESTIGILFFGVPTQGMDTRALRAMIGDKPQRYDLSRLDQEVGHCLRDQQHKAFCKAFDNKDSRIFQFFETKKTPTVKQNPATKLWARSGPVELLVNPMSATYGRPWEDNEDHKIHLAGDHSSMVKFNRQDEGYRKVRSKLEELTEHAVSIVQKREVLKDKENEQNDENFSEEVQEAFLTQLTFPEMESRSRVIGHPLEKTFRWIWESSSHGFPEWIEDDVPFFWISGIPGSGKSVLTKYAYQQCERNLAAQNQDLVVGHFFNDRGSLIERTAEGFFRSVIFQILGHFKAGLRPMLEHWGRMKDVIEQSAQAGSHYIKWPIDVLKEMFSDLAQVFSETAGDGVSENRIIVFVDAMDECDESFTHLKEVIQKLASQHSPRKAKIKFCCSSRPEPRMQILARSYQSLELQSRNVGDIRTYVETMMKSECIAEELNVDDLSALCDEIISRARGIILWARLVTPELLKRHEEGETLLELRVALDTIPDDLIKLYRRILEKIPYDNRPESRIILGMLLHARRQLTLEELRQAVAICSQSRENLASLDSQRVNGAYRRRLYSRCGALIEVTVNGNYVQFIHQTTKEFLQEEINFFPNEPCISPSGHYLLLTACTRLMALHDLPLTEEAEKPLLNYAKSFWIEHWREADKSPRECALIVAEADFSMDRAIGHECFEPEDVRLLGRSALFALAVQNNVFNFVVLCLKSGTSPNTCGSFGSVLQVAASNGNRQIVKVLLKHGADVNLPSGRFGSALNAAFNDQEMMVLLLDSGSKFLATSFGDFPLSSAMRMSNDMEAAIAKILLEYGALASEPDQNAILGTAAIQKKWDMVDLFLDHGTSVNMVLCRALRWFVGRKKLLNSKMTLLHVAVATLGPWTTIAKLLIRGIDYSVKDLKGSTALDTAVFSRASYETLKLLRYSPLLRDAMTTEQLAGKSIDEWDSWFRLFENTLMDTLDGLLEAPLVPFPAKAHLAHKLELLIESKVFSPLHIAADVGYANGVIELLKAGSDINSQDCHMWTPLHIAVSRDDTEIVRVLLENGANVENRNSGGSTPLSLAMIRAMRMSSLRGPRAVSTQILKLLIQYGSLTVNTDKSTIESVAAIIGDIELERLIDRAGGAPGRRPQGKSWHEWLVGPPVPPDIHSTT